MQKLSQTFLIQSQLFHLELSQLHLSWSFYEKFVERTNDYFKILGVDENTSFSEIKKTYLKKRKEFHPDTLIGKGLPEEFIEKAKEKFIEIQEAYEELEKRHQK